MPFQLPHLPGTSTHHDKTEASLDDVLPKPTQKADLLVLVSECIERMREGVTANFEELKAQPNDSTESQNEQEETQKSVLDLQWLSDDPVTSPQMQALKASALEYFNHWRTSVIKRMQEALHVRSDALDDARSRYLGATSTSHPEPRGNTPPSTIPLPSGVNALDEKGRALVLGAILFMLLSLEHYSAHSRILLSLLCQYLELPHDVLSTVEVTSAATLLDAASKGMDAEDARKKEAEEGSFGRKWKVGLAGVAGAIAIGVTGGLAAPVILGLAGTIMGGVGLGGLVTFLGATIANPIVIGAMFGMYGGKMTSRAMDAYAKEVNDFKFLPISDIKPEPASKSEKGVPSHKLRVAIGISGWVTNESDVSRPWRVFSSASLEPFALRYELAALITFGTGLTNLLKNTGFNYVRGKAIKFVLPTLAAAMAPLGLLKAGQLLDNPFTIAMERSDKAGKVLAHALIDRVQGERPVTLVGYSMGSRVVFSCLQELAARKAFGLVENAVLIGSPVPSTESSWRNMRAVVAGRLVNVYSEHDMILGYLYRARNLTLAIAGLREINAPLVENKNVSSFVSGHNQYRLAIGRILKELDFADLDLDQIAQEKIELEHEKIYEEEAYQQAKKEGRLEGLEDEDGHVMVKDHPSQNKAQAEKDTTTDESQIIDKLEQMDVNDSQKSSAKMA